MATCLQSITTLMAGPGIDSLTEILPATNTSLFFTPVSNELLLAKMEIQQTVTFTVTLAPTVPGLYNATLSIYSVVGTTITAYASINLTSSSVSFSKDFQAGNYIFCFHANSSAAYGGNIVGSFVGVPSSAVFFPTFPTGENIKVELTIPSPPRVCGQVMFYEVVEGEVPPGVYLDELGTLRGTLPNLDCVGPDQYGYDYSPSFNWFYERSGVSYPIGRQWRFKVKLSLGSNPDIFVTDWYCIRVVNNWDFDRDNFISQLPFDHTTQTVIYDTPRTLEPVCEDCPPESDANVAVVPKSLEQQCIPCDQHLETGSVSLIQIPKELESTPPAQFALWYAHNQFVDYSESCPDVQKFINSLRTSPLFQKLLAQNGLAASTDPTPQQLVIASIFNNYLQLAAERLKDGRNATDIDQQLLEWQFKENQSNPLISDVLEGATIAPFELVVRRG
jgi:hypothetical protein